MSSTRFSFSLPSSNHVEVRVYDVAGRVVNTLHTGYLDAGKHDMAWDGFAHGELVPSGLYFIRMQADNLVLQAKAVKLD
jgi:flagellar hook assembly protein FlgD